MKSVKSILSATDRLRLVAEKKDSGMSNRAIARELGVDEGTVRRDLEKLRLPKAARQAVEDGKPAEPLLADERRTRAHRLQQEQIGQRADDEARAEHARKLIINALKDEPLLACDMEMILKEVEWRQARRGADPSDAIRAQKPTGTQAADMPNLINEYVAWITVWLPGIVPNRSAREEGLRLARRECVRAAAQTLTPDLQSRLYSRGIHV